MGVYTIESVPAVDTAVVRDLLELAVGIDDPGRLIAAVASYSADNASLIGAYDSDCLLGVLGIAAEGSRIVLKHIATQASLRHRNIGRALVEWVASRRPGLAMVAETVTDSVGFYRRLGFTVTTLGEKYPGVERFAVRRGSTG